MIALTKVNKFALLTLFALFTTVPASPAVPAGVADGADFRESTGAPQQETFSALAQHVSLGQARVLITITRWTSVAERDHLLNVLVESSMQDLADELRHQEEVGFIRVPTMGGTSWRLRYAAQFGDGDRRVIRLAADRPISFWEAIDRPQPLWDHQVTMIELIVDENGAGEGVLAAGVEFGVDAEDQVLTIKHLAMQPIRLSNVRKETR